MNKIFVKIYTYFNQHKWLLFTILSATTIGLIFSAMQLHFVEDIGSFLPGKGNNKRINYAYQHIGAENRIVVNIKDINNCNIEDIDFYKLNDFTEAFVTNLRQKDSNHHIKDIFYQVDQEKINEVTHFVISNMPYFLSDADYASMDSMLTENYINRQLLNDKQLLSSPIGFTRQMILSDPMFFSKQILQNLGQFQVSEQYSTEDDYLFNKDGTEEIVVITSKYPISESAGNRQLIQLIEESISETETAFNNQIKASAFGASMVSITNAQQIKKDSLFAILLSLIFIIALLIYFYRNGKSIFLIVLSILFGGIFALGSIALFKNTISIIAVGMASIIVGIAVNYPIHFLSYFKRTNDKKEIIKNIVNPLLIGNITTVGAFLSLLFISSEAMKDLGLFAALLLVGTILFVLIFLPHFLNKHHHVSEELTFKRIAEFSPETKPILICIILLLTVVFYLLSSRTSFDTNMHAINYMTKEQEQIFKKLAAENDTSCHNMFCISEGTTINEALNNYEKAQLTINQLYRQGALKKTSGIGNFLPSKELQAEKLEKWNIFWKEHRTDFLSILKQSAHKNGFNATAFADFENMLSKDFDVQDFDYFAPIYNHLASNYIVKDSNNILVYNILQVRNEYLSTAEDRLNSINDHIFAFDDVSIASRMASALSNDFNYVLYICGFIVFIFLILSFGRLEVSLIAFTPLALAWIWILGIMGLTGLKFNIVNIILATFIFGQGDDYSIFVTEGALYEYKNGKKMLPQFKNSIILSSLLMFIGIGMLIFAKHPAMKSLAEVTIIGMFTVVAMAYIFPPFIFQWLTRKKGKVRMTPITLWKLLLTAFEWITFIFFCIILSIGNFLLLAIGRRTEKNIQKFHSLAATICKLCSLLVYGSPFKIENPQNEQFDKPAIIISNHQSFLDLTYLLMLHPRMAVLTKDYVQHSFLNHLLFRKSDYLIPASAVNLHMEKIQDLIHRNYSILIFPEGTRSITCEIQRFHQGAFYLADKLNVDILPIVLHGSGHILPKTEMLFCKGSVNIKILNRIHPDNPIYRNNGLSPIKKTHLFRKFYQDEYKKMVTELEDAKYMKYFVIQNYIYKGGDVERTCRKKLRNIDAINKKINALPDHGTLLLKHCGQGELSLLIALVKKDLQVTAFDNNEDSIAIANNCNSKPKNLTYLCHLPEENNFDLVIEEDTFLN